MATLASIRMGIPIRASLYYLAPYDLTRGGTLFPSQRHTDSNSCLSMLRTPHKREWSLTSGCEAILQWACLAQGSEPRSGSHTNIKI